MIKSPKSGACTSILAPYKGWHGECRASESPLLATNAFAKQNFCCERMALPSGLCRTPRTRRVFICGNHPVSSDQAPSRHMTVTAYCCSVPRLTRFTGRHCARPNRQHYLNAPAIQKKRLNRGHNLRYSGLRIQGTATSPAGTAL